MQPTFNSSFSGVNVFANTHKNKTANVNQASSLCYIHTELETEANTVNVDCLKFGSLMRTTKEERRKEDEAAVSPSAMIQHRPVHTGIHSCDKEACVYGSHCEKVQQDNRGVDL